MFMKNQQTHTTHNAESYQPLHSIRINSAGRDELPDDDTCVSKHAGTAE
jgi:hypothetical protein